MNHESLDAFGELRSLVHSPLTNFEALVRTLDRMEPPERDEAAGYGARKIGGTLTLWRLLAQRPADLVAVHNACDQDPGALALVVRHLHRLRFDHQRLAAPGALQKLQAPPQVLYRWACAYLRDLSQRHALRDELLVQALETREAWLRGEARARDLGALQERARGHQSQVQMAAWEPQFIHSSSEEELARDGAIADLMLAVVSDEPVALFDAMWAANLVLSQSDEERRRARQGLVDTLAEALFGSRRDEQAQQQP